MKHRIETNVVFNSSRDADFVRITILRKIEDDQAPNIALPFVEVGSVVVVEVEGNGALLRTASFALDVAGMLD
jgi:hypothetical protein